MKFKSFSIETNGAQTKVINPDGDHKAITLDGSQAEYIGGTKLSDFADISQIGQVILAPTSEEMERVYSSLGLGDNELTRLQLQNARIPKLLRALDLHRNNPLTYAEASNGDLVVLAPSNPATPGFFYLSGDIYDNNLRHPERYMTRAGIIADQIDIVRLETSGKRVLLGNVFTTPDNFRAAEGILRYPGFVQAAQIAVDSGDMFDLEEVGKDFLRSFRAAGGQPTALLCALVDRQVS